MKKHHATRSKLKAMKERFERQRIRAEDLREGVNTKTCTNLTSPSLTPHKKLFSASIVVESRLSTRLAQNVKLLTYVSIFYLPLAFCAVSLQDLA